MNEKLLFVKLKKKTNQIKIEIEQDSIEPKSSIKPTQNEESIFK